MSNRYYKKRVYELQPGVWTPVIACMQCDTFWLRSQDNTNFLEDTTGTGGDADIIPGQALQYLPPFPQGGPSGTGSRFAENDIMTYLSGTAANQKVTITFIR